MIGQDADGPTGTFVSPPCSIHELDPAYLRVSDALDPRQRPGVKRWRKAERVRRIKHRLTIATKTHRQHDTRIAEGLETAIGCIEELIVSAYWPFCGEPNLRSFLKRVEARGGRCALPVVIEHGEPLVFRAGRTRWRAVPGASPLQKKMLPSSCPTL